MPYPKLLTAGALSLALSVFAAPALGADFADPALNIIPSGQYQPGQAVPDGLLPADAQAQMYAGLTPLYDQVTPDALTKYFKSAKLTAEDSCPCRTEAVPRGGVTIIRDKYNVPHITGATRDDVTWATGWVLQEDRSLLLAAGRYPARLAALDAPNTSAFSLVTTLKKVVPTAAADKLIDRPQTAALQKTANGRALLHDIDVYVSGINDRLKADGSSEKPWTRVDVYAVNALVGQIFGQGGGREVANAEFLSDLRKRFGDRGGRRIFDDLSSHLDTESPNTTPRSFKFLPVPQAAKGNVTVDANSFKPATSGNQLAGQASARAASTPHMSNFLMVSASRSESGHPIFVGGPQIGYFFPGLTLEMDLSGPGFQARGASAPGFPGNILIGRGQDNAWTLTSAGSDNIDHYGETLCGGSKVKYKYKGRCRTMGTVNFGTVNGRKLAWRTTVHGPVVGYAKSGGRTIALSRRRASFGRDVLFQLPFRDMTLNNVRNAQDFTKSFAQSPFTFNAGYADDRDIAFYSAGLLPTRAKNVDPRLPTNGEGKYEWKGTLAASRHAQDINPSDGTLVNWNNRPSAGWGAADDNWEYTPVQRVQMLDAGLARAQKQTPASVVAAMNRAATTDLRVEQVFPLIEEVLKGGPAPSAREQRMIDLIAQWRAQGPAWLDRNGDGKVDSPAAAIVQDLYPRMVTTIMEPVLGAANLKTLRALTGANADPASDFTGGQMGYVVKDLNSLLGKPGRGRYRNRFCGKGDLTSCRKRLWLAVKTSGDALAKRLGSANPDDWRIAEPTIKFAPLGNPIIPYTNRPSGIQQVLTFTGRR